MEFDSSELINGKRLAVLLQKEEVIDAIIKRIDNRDLGDYREIEGYSCPKIYIRDNGDIMLEWKEGYKYYGQSIGCSWSKKEDV